MLRLSRAACLESALSTKSYSEWLEDLNAVYRLDVGIIPGFVGWLGNAIKGDFGDSWHYGVPVTEKFNDVVWYIIHNKCHHICRANVNSDSIRNISCEKAIQQNGLCDFTVFALMGISLANVFPGNDIKVCLCD